MANFRSLKIWGPREFLEWAESNYPSNRIVQVVDLSRSGMTVLPTQIDRLVNLWNLDLSHNRLTRLPETIGGLSKLRDLNVSHNRLTNLPATFTRLGNLRRVNLSNNELVVLPDTIGSLRNIDSINLNNNRLTRLPDSISGLANMLQLELKNNQLISLPESIGALSSLHILELKNNRLTSLPRSISRIGRLSILDVSHNRLTNLPDDIGGMDFIEHLDASHNQLTTPLRITNMYELEELNLSFNQLREFPFGIVRNTPFLEILHIEGNQLNQESLEALERLLPTRAEIMPDLEITIDGYMSDFIYPDRLPYARFEYIDNVMADTKPAREIPLGGLSFGFHNRRKNF